MEKERVMLQIMNNRLILVGVIESKNLRMPKRIFDAIIDTGSVNSYLSQKDVERFQISVQSKNSEGEVDFGGSRFVQAKIPDVELSFFKGESKELRAIKIPFRALKTTKSSERKKIIASELPSILGMDFLSNSKYSLHVVLTENIAYLQYEG